jgi:hypothetical protein
VHARSLFSTCTCTWPWLWRYRLRSRPTISAARYIGQWARLPYLRTSNGGYIWDPAICAAIAVHHWRMKLGQQRLVVETYGKGRRRSARPRYRDLWWSHGWVLDCWSSIGDRSTPCWLAPLTRGKAWCTKKNEAVFPLSIRKYFGRHKRTT